MRRDDLRARRPFRTPTPARRPPCRPGGARLRPLLLGLAACAPAWGAEPERPEARLAAAPAAPTAAAILPPVSLSATREARPVDETASTVTVIEAEAIERGFVKDVRDLVRAEPGVSVRRAPARFGLAQGTTGREGNAGFNIRGLDGNRVLIQVDGIRVPAAFSFGASSFGRGDFVDLSTLRQVEILRGPASTLYGADGLAGVVSFYTVDPVDLLGPGAGARHGSLGLAWAQEDRSLATHLRAAARLAGEASAGTELMAIVGQRRGHALETAGGEGGEGPARSRANPQDREERSLLLKAVHRPDPLQQWRFTLDHHRQAVNTDVRSGLSSSVLGLRARDTVDRDRVSLDARFDGLDRALADSLQVAAYAQQADNRQRSAEDRATLADRRRDNHYEERLVGLNLQAGLRSRAGGLPQRLVYGLDLAQARIDNLRDGSVPPAGETFPTKAFPATDFTTLGAFLQNELQLGERWVLTPALRYDRFRLAPREQVPGLDAVRLSDGRFTPKLALRWKATEAISGHLNLAQGYRAPTPDQVNNGFTNLSAPFFAYRSVGNPSLRPERSRTVELGLQGEHGRLRWQVVGFDGRYQDFIERVLVGGSGRQADPQIFQFINLGEARIRGHEARLAWQPTSAWTLEAGYARARGESAGADRRPLNSIDPPKLSLRARWSPQPAWRLGATLVHARAKDEGDIDASGLAAGSRPFAPPSFTTLDLHAHWTVSRQVELGAGIFNLTDRRHWHWADVVGLAAGSAGLDAYTQPGRSLALRLKITL